MRKILMLSLAILSLSLCFSCAQSDEAVSNSSIGINNSKDIKKETTSVDSIVPIAKDESSKGSNTIVSSRKVSSNIISSSKKISSNMISSTQSTDAYHRVTFKDGKKTLYSGFRVEHGKAVPTNMLRPPQKLGFVFDGWDKPLNNVTSDMTVYAKWKPTTTHTVTFKDGENIVREETVNHETGAHAPELPKKDGFLFGGWDKSFIHVTSDLIVHAKWTTVPVVMSVGQTRTVSLYESGTYAWSYTVTPSDGIGVTYIYSGNYKPPGFIGGGTNKIFTFTAQAPGVYTVYLKYADQWDQTIPPGEEISFTITVNQ